MKKVLALLVLATLFLHACATEKETENIPQEDSSSQSDTNIQENSPSKSNAITQEDNTSTPLLEEKIKNKIVFYINPLSLGGLFGHCLEEAMKRYPDRCIYKTYPTDYVYDRNEQELFVSSALEIAEDPEVNVFVMASSAPGTKDIFAKIRERHPDILTICICSGGNIIMNSADIVLLSDEIGMIKKEVNQAHSMGAKTFIYYSGAWDNSKTPFDDLKESTIKEECSILGIQYIHKEPPYESIGPVRGSSINIERYGKDISFYYADGYEQEVLLLALDENFIYVQQDNYSDIYSDFPSWLGIEIDDDHVDDFDWINGQIKEKLAELGSTGRFALLPAPFYMISTTAAVEYAIGYCDDRITEKVDPEALQGNFEKAFEIYGFTDIGFELKQDGDNDNRFLYATDYVVY